MRVLSYVLLLNLDGEMGRPIIYLLAGVDYSISLCVGPHD